MDDGDDPGDPEPLPGGRVARGGSLRGVPATLMSGQHVIADLHFRDVVDDLDDPPASADELAAVSERPDPQTESVVPVELPIRREPVSVVEADPRWIDQFAVEAARLRSVLAGGAQDIEHVGSTSVPGPPAKPIIDIDVRVSDTRDEAVGSRS